MAIYITKFFITFFIFCGCMVGHASQDLDTLKGTVHTIATLYFEDNPEKSKLIPLPQDSIYTWNDFLQKNFLRPANLDHQNLHGLKQDPIHNRLMPYFKELGLVKATLPSNETYDHVVILGGTLWHAYDRVMHLKMLMDEEKLCCNKFIFLNGLRTLNDKEVQWLKDKDYIEEAYSKPLTQDQGADFVWQTFFKASDVFLDHYTINPPKERRANTKDTVKNYFSIHKNLSTLFITNAPYGPYQGQIVKNVGKDYQTYETVQGAAAEDISTLSLLDTIARWVYELSI